MGVTNDIQRLQQAGWFISPHLIDNGLKKPIGRVPPGMEPELGETAFLQPRKKSFSFSFSIASVVSSRRAVSILHKKCPFSGI